MGKKMDLTNHSLSVENKTLSESWKLKEMYVEC